MSNIFTFPKIKDDNKPLRLMTSKQVKEYLGISKSTLNRWVNEEGVIPKMKIRNKLYFKRDVIEGLLENTDQK